VRLDPQGNVWVADPDAQVVMQFTPEGKLLRTLGTRGKPGTDETHFCLPTDMVVTPAGDIFVSDGYGNSRIVHFDKQGKFVKSWGKLGTGPGEFSIAHSVVVDSKGRLYVADRNNVRIQVFEQSGKFIAEWRNLLVPFGLFMTADDEIWACGSSPTAWRKTDQTLGVPFKDHLVMKFDTSGRVLQLWTLPKGEDGKERPGEVNLLHGIAADADGNLYLGDIGGQRMQKFVRQK
jgi:DNA-binding beta-propeller fold protein YncE